MMKRLAAMMLCVMLLVTSLPVYSDEVETPVEPAVTETTGTEEKSAPETEETSTESETTEPETATEPETEETATEPTTTESETEETATEPETEESTTDPEATEPETTDPETEESATEPETEEPTTTEPETGDEPETTDPETTDPEETEPEETDPETTDPETTDPETTDPEEDTGSIEGEQAAEEEPAEFVVTEKVLTAYNGTSVDVDIPESLGIEKIGEGAFAGNTTINSVVIPTGVKEIAQNAFNGCTGLKKVKLPDTLTAIGTDAFKDCPLEEVKVDCRAKAMATFMEANYTVTCALVHDNIVTLAAVPATCKETGLTEGKKCANCNEVTVAQEETALADHTPVEIPAVPATCEETGLTAGSKCSVCGTILVAQEETEFAEHTPEEIPAVPATCKETGLTAGSRCSVCGTILVAQEETALAEHTPEEIPAVNATCENTGLTAGSKCSVCGTILVEQEVTELAEHTPEEIPAVNATCKETGLTAGSRCSVCGEILLAQEVTPVGGHTPEEIPAVKATCIAYGYTAGSRCSVCGEILVTPALINTYGEHESKLLPAVSATCAEPGLTEGSVCAICGEVLVPQETVIASHTIVTDAAVPATRESTGLTEGSHCAVCELVIVSQEVVPVLTDGIRAITVTGSEMGTGESTQLLYTVDTDETGYTVTFATSNKAVIAIDENGLMTAKKTGTATITVTATGSNTVTKAVKFTVKNATKSLTLSAPQTVMGVGEQMTVTPVFSKSATIYGITWTSSDEAVAVVEGGVVKAVAAGSATITAVTSNGKSATVAITVKAAPGNIRINDDDIALGVGEKYVTSASFANADEAGAITWTSSDTKVVTCVNGTLTAKAAGVATIRAESYNGLYDEITVTVTKAPSKVTLNVTKATLGVGETITLIPTLTIGTTSCITWKSSSTKVATVDANGVVTAIKTGSATITAKTVNGKTATCKITVSKAPTAITLSATTLTLGVGESATVKATLPKSTSSAIAWNADSDIVTVENGVITANRTGTAIVTASTYVSGVTAQCVVTVKNAPTAIDITDDTVIDNKLTLSVSQTYTLSPVMPEGEAGKLTFSTGSAKYATVDQTGKIKAVKAGTVAITVTAYNGVQATCTVTIVAAPKSVSLDKKSATIGVGDAITLVPTVSAAGTPVTYTWSSSKTSVATVDQNGVVTAVKTGSAKITVKTHNGKSATCTVTVKAAPVSVSIPAELTLGVGERVTLPVTLSSGSASTIWWKCDNENASVQNGVVEGLSVGTCVVMARTFNGKTATCTVTVKAAPTEILIPVTEVDLSVGQSFSLPAELPEGESGELTYATSSIKIATVDKNGLIKAVKAGTAYITVTAYNGVQATCAVTIVAAPKSVSLDKKTVSIGVGDAITLIPAVSPAGTPVSYTWSSSKTSVATVDRNGVVTAVNTGSSKITVKTHNGKTATCTVTVKAAPESVSIPASKTIGVGESITLPWTVPTGKVETTINWTVSPEGVLTVDENGAITGTAIGTATVTATTYNGKSADCVVTVKAAPTQITLDIHETKQLQNATLQLTATLPEGEAGTITFTSSDTSLATVDQNGLVTLKKQGTVTITPSTYNGCAAESCVIQIYPPVTSFTVTAPTSMVPMATSQLTHTIKPAAAAELAVITYATSNASVIAVDENGLLTAVGKGSATITIKCGKFTVTKKITVKDYSGAVEIFRGSVYADVKGYFGGSFTRYAAGDTDGCECYNNSKAGILFLVRPDSGMIDSIKVTGTSFTLYGAKTGLTSAKLASALSANFTKQSEDAKSAVYFSEEKGYIVATMKSGKVTSLMLTKSYNGTITEGKFSVRLNDAGTGVILTGYNGTDSAVVVPETIDGYTVLEIGDGAFENNTTLTSIDLPDTVEVIGERAFAGCSNLKTMN